MKRIIGLFTLLICMIMCVSLIACSGGGGGSSSGNVNPAPVPVSSNAVDAQLKDITKWQIAQTKDQ